MRCSHIKHFSAVEVFLFFFFNNRNVLVIFEQQAYVASLPYDH